MAASATTATATSAAATQPAAPGGPPAADAKADAKKPDAKAAAVDLKAAEAAALAALPAPEPKTFASRAAALADLKAVLTARGLLAHLTHCDLTAAGDGAAAAGGATLVLAGKVPVAAGSDLNMTVADWVEGARVLGGADGKTPVAAVGKVSRAGITWVPRHVGTGQYELSPDDADLTEYHDTAQELDRKLQWTARRMLTAKHVVAYTGAGISTAAKIPDFRGPQGVWTRRDRGQAAPKSVAMEQALPTLAHRALVRLLASRRVAYLVSQNVDGLHRRSGVAAADISELHGNCYIETCAGCGAEHLRTFDVCARRGTYFAGVRDTASASGISHITGRVCEHCKKGMLRDSIIHFSENLPEQALQRAVDHSRASDLALILGTSLRVSPACDLPQNVKRNGGPMVCCNLQATGKDATVLGSGGILVHAKCDAVMSGLMALLGQPFADADAQAEIVRELAAFEALALASAADRKAQDDLAVAALAKKQAAWAAAAAASKAADDAKAAAAAAAAAAVPAQFYVGNLYAPRPSEGAGAAAEGDPNAHKWTLFVSAAPDRVTSCAAFVERVHVRLHETFHPRDLTLRPGDPQGLTLTRLGWGTFTVRLTVHFVAAADRDPLAVAHDLVFDESQPVVATAVATPPPRKPLAAAPAAGLMASVAAAGGVGGANLKPTQTKVTTVTGHSYIEPKANGGGGAGGGKSGSGGSGGSAAV